jgi:hypothetical protein
MANIRTADLSLACVLIALRRGEWPTGTVVELRVRKAGTCGGHDAFCTEITDRYDLRAP